MFVKLTNDRAKFLEAKAKHHLGDILEPGTITDLPPRLAKAMFLDRAARPVTLPASHYFNPDVPEM